MKRLSKRTFKPVLESVEGRVADMRRKGKHIRLNLTTNYLRRQFETQDGRCSMCGIELDLTGKGHQKSIAPDMRISVDKVKPRKGYVRGNIALLHCCCNRFKGQLDGNFVYAIARRIVEHFEKTYPTSRAEIDLELKDTVDGQKFMFPRYSCVASGSVKKPTCKAEVTLKPSDLPQPPAK